MDQSVDVVVSSSRGLTEARRVASAAVFVADPESETVREVWRVPEGASILPSASIVIPVFNQSATTDECLHAVLDTLPFGFRGEILVVDDASTDDTPDLLARWMARDSRIRTLRNEKNLGFLDTCNRAAAAATGEILVLLNNDTLPRPGWLPPLLRVLVENRSAGAVGGKLLFPDGTLQEAGGVIFSDASGANIGRGDSRPDRPIYSMLREVDYCSGALLATPRALFLELGGFDTRFRPAYYEDTDYCFTLRERGYRVFFQPESEVVHKEGVTSGTDLSAGVKQHQVVNQVRFREKWSKVLPGHLTSKAPDAVAIHEWVFARPSR